MYKDKEKQREANRLAKERWKAKQQGIPTDEGIPTDDEGIPAKNERGIPPALHLAIVAGINRLTTNPDGTVDEQARVIRMVAAKEYQRLYPSKQYTGVGIAPEDLPACPVPVVRVSKPGDADYKPLCEPVTVTGTVKGGICWCCGADIHTALVCCGPCTGSGKAEAQRAGREPLVIGQQAWEDMYVY